MNPVNSPDLSNLNAEQKRALLSKLLQRKASQTDQLNKPREKTTNQSIPAKPTRSTAPLSFAQQRLWFIDQLQPGQGVYNIPAALRLEGDLQTDILHRCLNDIIARHDILRTQFVTSEDEPIQKILRTVTIELPIVELPEIVVDQSLSTYLQPQLQEIASEPFDLESGPLLRCQLLRLDETDHILVVVVHHIVADYWSLRVLMKEIVLIYRSLVAGQQFSKREALPTHLPPLPIQYGDYAAWQQTHVANQGSNQLDYWRKQLAHPPAVLQLPTDRPRPSIQTFSGAKHSFALSAELSSGLKQLAQRSQTTLFMTLLAAFQVLLYRYSGQSDILVGSTVSNRNRAETKDLIGLFVNNLVFRASLDSQQSFQQFLQQVKATAIEAYTHQDIPFEQVVDTLSIDRQLSHNALFQAMFILHNTPKLSFELPDLKVTPIEIESNTARFDLSLDMYENETELTGTLEYNTELFNESTVERFSDHFRALLSGIIEKPETPISALPLLTRTELSKLADWNQTTVDIPQKCAHELIEAQTEKTPDAIALSLDHTRPNNVASQFSISKQSWTYHQLNQRANQLAHYLSSHGATPRSRIALAINRSAELMIALLAILKLGGTYIPLDPTHPESRLKYVLQDADVSLILESDASLSSHLTELAVTTLDIKKQSKEIDHCSSSNLDTPLQPNDLAYIIYTSGSTGNPKGVPIRHRSLVNLLSSMSKAPGVTADDAILAVTTISFDIATLELLLPLIVGARLSIASDETVRDSDRLIAQLESHDITVMQATPATWRLLLDSGWQGSQTLKVLCGGEALDLPLAQQLLTHCRELWNLYGPTETTIWSSAIRISSTLLETDFVPVGGPIDNTTFYVLDEQQQILPIGISGELYIGGKGLSPGYLNRSELTTEKFQAIPLPFDSAQGNPHSPTLSGAKTPILYRTGDRVRRHPNGTLEFLSRLDHQIKLRGFRIELGDIETALISHLDIDQALVTLHQGKESSGENKQYSEPQLVAYCKVKTDIDIESNPAENIRHIRQHLSQKLPAYMVPTAYILLTDFPLTPNGKIDRKALPEPIGSSQAAAKFVAPKTNTEQTLAALWSETLKVERIGIHDNFFDLGGHSLLAARMIARSRTALNKAISLRSLFENPTLSTFAAVIDATENSNRELTIPSVSREQTLPLSFAQQRQWVLAQLEPDSPFYNIPAALQITGTLSLSTLEESLNLLCQRHEELRSTFTAVNGKAQLNILPTASLQIEYVYLREENHQEADIQARLTPFIRRSFDLSAAPLMRAKVIQIEEEKYIVSLVLHHIIGDAASVNLLMKETVYIYKQLQTQQEITLPNLPIQYVDYAAWQQTLDTTEQLTYWQQQLADAPPLLALPTDFPRPVTQQFDGDSYHFTLSPTQTHALQQLSQQHNATLFMTLMAAFQLLLHRYSNMEDIVVGTPISQRPNASLENVLGIFVNTLAIRSDFSQEKNFSQLIEQVRDTALAAYAHQEVPFEQVIDSLDIDRNWSHSPLFQAMFVWQAKQPTAIETLDEVIWTPLPLQSTTAKVDLTLSMAEVQAAKNVSLSGKLEYRRDLFKRGTIEAMADAFCTLLEAIVQSPEQSISTLPLVSTQQQQQLNEWNNTTREYPGNLCLHQLFEQQVMRSPQSPALITQTETLSYQTLNDRANQLAQSLSARGIAPESRIAICLDRTAKLITAILAVLKAGGAYVPLDPTYPQSRLAYILEDAQVSIVITQSEYEKIITTEVPIITLSEELLQSQTYGENKLTDPQPNNLAYIIYTSGSTGKPKGVAIEHRSPVALVQWANETYTDSQLSGVLAATSVCFDLSIFEIFVPLSRGGSIILAKDILQLPAHPAAEQVTLINTVPTAITELVRINGIPQSATTINLAGEPIPPTLVNQLYALQSVQKVFNLYGPSEDTTYSTYTLLTPDEPVVPIGKPIANTQAFILDKQQNPVPIGMPGELYLSGAGLARGYWNQPALTAERFIPPSPPLPLSHILYKTGDLTRHRPDGQLDFLGRIDNQVKVRGSRIELGEIEAALLAHAQVTQVAASAQTDKNNNHRLVAYVVLREVTEKEAFGKALSPTSVTFERLRSYLQSILPSYMLPATFVVLESLPLLPNGKVNRKALPIPIISEIAPTHDQALTPAEQTLVEIWQKLLGRSVGIYDNFFELGGDSILAIQVIAQAQQAGLQFSARDLFQNSTIYQLAGISHAQLVSLVPQAPIVGPVPLTPIQHWFFEQPLSQPHHWNQSVLLTVKQALQPKKLTQALRQIIHHHDALRATFERTDSGWQQSYREPSDHVPLRVIQAKTDSAAQLIADETEAAQKGFDLINGPLLQVIYFELETATEIEYRLFIACHHLIIDGVSWRILLSDLQNLYAQLAQSEIAQLPPKTISCQHWIEQLETTDFSAEVPYWSQITSDTLHPFPQDFDAGQNTMATADTVSVSLSTEDTARLIKEVPNSYSARIDDILLTALLLALAPEAGPTIRVSLEGHGRPLDTDLSRTVGWLTTLYPVCLSVPSSANAAIDKGLAIKAVKETLRSVPNQGIGYGVLNYLQHNTLSESPSKIECPIRFNYLGQTDQLFTKGSWFTPATESTGAARSPHDPRDVLIEINAVVSQGHLTVHWTYSYKCHKAETIASWAKGYLTQLSDLIAHCLSTETDSGYSPTDFPQMGLDQSELDDLLASLGGDM
ncbi:MAG: amino acid adenylation domain-containing protein [Cyanobacteria bacterium J06623_4]